jgi:hypothetical protein
MRSGGGVSVAKATHHAGRYFTEHTQRGREELFLYQPLSIDLAAIGVPAACSLTFNGSGTTPGNVAKLQRDQLSFPRRIFGEVTSRIRRQRAWNHDADDVLTA